MDQDDSRALLGRFVRARREALEPAAAAARRRRTPGLKREELAERAGISATWVTWIEQGRAVQASAHALDRLAQALALSPAERAYLFELAGRRDPEAPDPAPPAETPAALRAAVQALAHPAYGLDRLWNACCWNAAAERLFAGWLGPGGERNQLRYLFLSPEAGRLLPDWRERARRVAAEFRADFGRSLGDPQVRALVEGLAAESRAFAEAWSDTGVLAREGGRRAFDHPLDGHLVFDQHTFAPAERPDHKLVLLVPAAP
ncbi:helix-turn-helix transcriptional regulator [Caulobacter sp. KR2-114]|uniref:helix-turn-helix transcriptional regulator n=1 Tax=Caulobacter sp. KR2-114 TaxID=3400912 RepID=UPI003C105353